MLAGLMSAIWPRMNRAAFIEWRNELRGDEVEETSPKRLPAKLCNSVFAAISIINPEQLSLKKVKQLKDELDFD